MQIYLAGGCFWGVQAYFDLLRCVESTRVGYANAQESALKNLSYEVVCSGLSGAVEAVEIAFDEGVLPLEEVLARFFSIIDPVSVDRQGNDIGSQYRSGIYARDLHILDVASEFITRFIAPKVALRTSKQIATEVLLLRNFTPAESYHQKYLANNPNGYCHIDISKALKPIES